MQKLKGGVVIANSGEGNEKKNPVISFLWVHQHKSFWANRPYLTYYSLNVFEKLGFWMILIFEGTNLPDI